MEKKKNRKGLIIAGSMIGSLLLLLFVLFFVLTTHTQIVVGLIQKATYGDKSFNSYEPYYEPINGLKENGQYLISEIKYDDEYPNSYLDITYPDGDLTADRPTLVYFHGGGFFAGSKNMGDPLAASEATALLDDICAQGYNIVNVDYALVSAAHFPVPLIQANRAFAYLLAHQDEYHLDMDNIVIMGSSAGAILSSQMGSIVTNPEYADLLGITPALTPEQVKAVVLDDAPLDYNHFDLATKMLVGNYVKGSIYLNKGEIKKYNNIGSLTANYPAAVLLGSEYRLDMNVMHKELNSLGCEHILVDPYAERGVKKQHCFVAEERVDEIAKDAFDRMMDFINNKTK
ncbi:MAG: alpha/beta hydrolase [Clostridia bacterium]|nr:alpha/beta hydrolase [Clostridia bacterium]